ncbi:DUF1722 domain-containing protein [Moellerella wisconsensis]|uniref:YbgA family protein n=1 Tax=Moellerella wisconsensis TaxID=158849 RepID=UPI001F4E4B4D|nr:DUF1722 domain-containing protein [Moellerella wisconsensis]UNH43099.1 DUF1722 domain-containing protein [Moellerella wisconsensis]
MKTKPNVRVYLSAEDWNEYFGARQDNKLIQCLSSELNLQQVGDQFEEEIKIAGAIFAEKIAPECSGLPTLSMTDMTDPVALDHFMQRVFMLNELQQYKDNLSVKSLIEFHSKYKYLFMSYSQAGYKRSGKMIADAYKMPNLAAFFVEYCDYLLAITSNPPKRGDQSNTLSHLQGYFKKNISADEKAQLTQLIDDYRHQRANLSQPIEFMLELLQRHPDDYLSQQRYFLPYPSANQWRKLL